VYNVVAKLDPFSERALHLSTRDESRETIQGLLDDLIPDPAYQDCAFVFIEDGIVPPALRAHVRAKPGVTVYVKVMPQLPAVPLVAAIGGAFAANAVATVAGSLIVGSLVGFAVSTAISFVGNALFAPSNPTNAITARTAPAVTSTVARAAGPRGASGTESPTFSILSARNSATPYRPIPMVLGVHRYVPAYGALPYTEVSGDDQYLRFVVIWGYGPVSLSTVKIGNTLIGNFTDVEQENDLTGTLDTLTLYPQDASQENLSIALENYPAYETRTTALNTDEIGITVTFPQGLVHFRSDSPDRFPVSVELQADYRPTGGGIWLSLANLTITDSTTEVKRYATRSVVTRNTYDVRVRARTTSTHPDGAVVRDASVWTALRSFTNEDPVAVAGVAKSAYRILASDQLNGVVDQLNGVIVSQCEIWSGSSWGTPTTTNNPAALFRYVLTCDANANRVTSAAIDETNLADWYEFCANKGFTFNQVIDFRVSVRELLRDIAAAGRASPTRRDSLWGVIIDEPRTTVVQHFSPRNTRNFSGQIIFPEPPHAYRVRFFNEEQDYREDERIVYDDGYDEMSATIFEGLELPGITRPDNIYKLTRYYLAGIRLRPERFRFDVDMENLVATRGDLIRFSHDVPQIGLNQGRISSVAGSVLGLDEPVDMDAGGSYSVRIRLSDGTSHSTTVTTVAGRSESITVGDATGVAAGDLFLFGEAGIESVELLITDLETTGDLVVTVSAVPYNEAIYDADTVIPPYTSTLSAPVSSSLTGPPSPNITDVVSDERALRRTTDGLVQLGIQVYIQPGVAEPSAAGVTATAAFQVRWRLSTGPGRWVYSPSVSSDTRTIIASPVESAASYDVAARAIDAVGSPSNWVQVSNHVVIGAVANPPDVSSFSIDMNAAVAFLSWTYPNPPLDLEAFEIRWHPNQNVTTWQSMSPVDEAVAHHSESFPVRSRTGSYAIKAVDYLGNKSINALFVNAGLEDAAPSNIIINVAEHPFWYGTFTDVVVNAGGDLELDSDTNGYLAEGTYEFAANDVDLGGVYTVEVLAHLDLGFNSNVNFMADWATLASVGSLSGSVPGSSTDNVSSFLEMAWSLEASGTPTSFTDYQPIVAGEYTARYLKFRFTLRSTGLLVTPTASEVGACIQIRDSVLTDNDLSSVGTGATSIAFSPAFHTLKSVTVNAQDMQQGDYWVVTNKSRTGFDIQFLDSGGGTVVRTFDWQAVGYGRERGT